MNEDVQHLSSKDYEDLIGRDVQMKMLCLKEIEVMNFITKD